MTTRKRLRSLCNSRMGAQGYMAPQFIVLCGMPGCGRTSLATLLHIALSHHPLCKPLFIGGSLTYQRKYLSKVEASLKTLDTFLDASRQDTAVTHIIVDTPAQSLTAGVSEKVRKAASVILFCHPNGHEAAYRICAPRRRHNPSMALSKEQCMEAAEAQERWATEGGGVAERQRLLVVNMTDTLEEIIDSVRLFLRLPMQMKDDWVRGALNYHSNRVLFLHKWGMPMLYASLDRLRFDNGDGHQHSTSAYEAILQLIPPSLLLGKILVKREDLHITLKFFGGVEDPLYLSYLADFVKAGRLIHVVLDAVISDPNATAIAVHFVHGDDTEKKSAEVLCGVAHPHITMAVGRTTKPVYCKELCNLEAVNPGRVVLPIPEEQRFPVTGDLRLMHP